MNENENVPSMQKNYEDGGKDQDLLQDSSSKCRLRIWVIAGVLVITIVPILLLIGFMSDGKSDHRTLASNSGSSTPSPTSPITAIDGSGAPISTPELADRNMYHATVFGGTGRVGSELVRQMLSDGKRLRLVARTPAKAEKMFGTCQTKPNEFHAEDDCKPCKEWTKSNLVQITKGDNLKMTSSEIRDAIRGSDSVVICSKANPAASVAFIHSVGMECAAQKVRLVYLSSWGAADPWNFDAVKLNLIASNTFKYHLEKEGVIREISELDYTIVRPSNFSSSSVKDPKALAVSQGSNPRGTTNSIPNVAYAIKTALERKDLTKTTFSMWDSKDASNAKYGWSTLKPDNVSNPLPSNHHSLAFATYGSILFVVIVALVAGCFQCWSIYKSP